MQTGLFGACRWSAAESILGGGIFKRNYGEFSTGVDKPILTVATHRSNKRCPAPS